MQKRRQFQDRQCIQFPDAADRIHEERGLSLAEVKRNEPRGDTPASHTVSSPEKNSQIDHRSRNTANDGYAAHKEWSPSDGFYGQWAHDLDYIQERDSTETSLSFNRQNLLSAETTFCHCRLTAPG